MINWNPTGMNYRVQITPPETQTKGGIFLPDGDPWNCNEGKVVKLGSGRKDLPSGICRKFQARVGERVLFERMDMEPGINEMEGVVSDEDIVAILTSNPGYGIDPCGEWLLVSGWRKRETTGGIEIPERYQNRNRSGYILAYGPGRLVKRGPREGLRITCGELLDGKPFEDIRGMTVHWGKNAKLLYSPGVDDWLMIKASCIIAVGAGDVSSGAAA
jgi:co-chaperonin GroES (HSP10)